MISIDRFQCPSCRKSSRVQVVMYDVIITDIVSHTFEDGDLMYSNKDRDYPQVGDTNFQCEYCSFLIPASDGDELFEWLDHNYRGVIKHATTAT